MTEASGTLYHGRGQFMMPGQVNPLAPDVDCCQIEKMPD